MIRVGLCLLAGATLFACGSETAPDGSDGDTGGTGGATASGGNASGGAGGAGGEGGVPVERCPSICAQFGALYDSYGCTLENCNCKEACADLHQAAIDCMPADSPACSCNASGELDCDNVCDEENMAANACFSAN